MNAIKEIQTKLDGLGVFPAELNEDSRFIYIKIEWGDWKHEHGALKSAMRELGYDLFNYEITEEDGSDCYSAEYMFERAA